MKRIAMPVFQTVFFIALSVCLTITTEAAEFQVDSSLDNETDGCGVNACTLREAINAANADAALDTVTFALSVTTVTLTAGEISITNDIEIGQNSATALTTVSGSNNGRIFNIAAGADTTINKLELVNGFVAGNGGAILNSGAILRINNSIIRDNEANGGNGGGIYNLGGTVNILNSTIGGTRLLGSNRANGGGGIYNENGVVNLVNSTVSGNSATNFGGGYYGFVSLGTASLTARKATIANNSASNGGGIAVSSAIGVSTADLNNTIVGDNNNFTAVPQTSPDIFSQIVAGFGGTVSSSGYNLIENTTGSNIILVAGTDQTGDAALLPLTLNGGLTPSHALQSSSNAIDKGSQGLNPINTPATVINTDQRGLPRPVNYSAATAPGGDESDIGAFELQLGATAATVTISGRVIHSSGKGVARARVSITGVDGQTRVTMTNFFGYYRFESVDVGETYIISAASKFYSFNPQIITVNEEINGLNFVAEP